MPDPEDAPAMPAPEDKKGWHTLHEEWEKARLSLAMKKAKALGAKVEKSRLGGVPVVIVTPPHYRESRDLLIYTHGGAYTMLSAESTVDGAALIAKYSGLKVISIDYTNPPNARWQKVTDEVLSVIDALVAQGYKRDRMVLMGDSAGGALAAGSVLKMRDRGLSLPAALVLWSPWADITETGDTYTTLKAAEPRFIYKRVLGPSALAYAEKKDQKNPYVSPVYGDFGKGFPPTLIQGGTREIFLSNFVRLYRAINTAGGKAVLDLYEGMPHVFQTTLPDSPESVTALKKTARFIRRYLKRATTPPNRSGRKTDSRRAHDRIVFS